MTIHLSSLLKILAFILVLLGFISIRHGAQSQTEQEQQIRNTQKIYTPTRIAPLPQQEQSVREVLKEEKRKEQVEQARDLR